MQRNANKLSPRIRLQAIALIALLVLVPSTPVAAQYSTAGAFATRGFRGRTPLNVSYSLDLAPSMTMGIVDVNISDTSGPSKVDRKLKVVLFTHNYGQAADNLAYQYNIELAEGMTKTQVQIPFPATEFQFSWDIGVFEEGRDIEDRRRSKSNRNQQDYHWSYNFNQSANLAVAGLMATTVDAKTESRNLKAISDFLDTQRTAAQTAAIARGGAVAGTALNSNSLIPVDKASGDWRYYFPYPVWIASVGAIAEINDKQPHIAEALRTYVSAGGKLVLYEVNAKPSKESVNRLLSNSGGNAELASWKYINADELLEREYGRGKVIICSKRLDELSENQVGLIVSDNDDKSISLLTARSHDGSWFWQNLILEVGKPPIWAFCVIVALFGALLGPGLLIFTGRMQRRSLMIFLVPTVSFIATLAIVLYGVLHEGFDTHVRIHSVTTYDGPAHVAFGWSRQNYFSGLPPRDGLQFSADAYVRPVAPDDVVNYGGNPDPRRNLDGTVSFGEKQTWNGWLKPRQHQQLLVGHKVDPSTIPISTERNEAGKLVLRNLTALKLPLVVLRGDKDDYYFEADLGPNESREPEVENLDTVAVLVSRIGVDFKPRIPPELEGGSDSLLNFGNARRYTRSYNVQASEMVSNAFKRYLSDDLELEPHEFATLVPEFDAIEIPLQGIQSDNVNLVVGVEPW